MLSESSRSLISAVSRPVMSNLRHACGPVEVFVQPNLCFHCSKCVCTIYTDTLSLLR